MTRYGFLDIQKGVRASKVIHLFLVLFLLSNIVSLNSSRHDGFLLDSPQKFFAIMVDTFSVVETPEDIPLFLSRARTHGVTTLFLLGKKRDGNRSGYVIHESSTAPQYYEWDVLEEFSTRAKEAGMTVYVWLPLLYDDYLFRQEGFGISNGWVSPINGGVKDHLKDMVSEIQRYNIDGILFDDLSYEDEYSASRELQTEFNKTFHYEDLTYSLPAEKERDSPIWRNWLSFKRSKLEELYLMISSPVEGKRMGILVPPNAFSEENQEGVDVTNYRNLSLIVVRNGDGARRAINDFYLQRDADVYVMVDNSDVRTLRDMSSVVQDRVYRSPLWTETEFKRIEKAAVPFSSPVLTRIALLDYFRPSPPDFTKSGIDTMVIPAGNVDSTLFYYAGRKEVWSPYVQKYKRDYVEEYLLAGHAQDVHVVLEVDVESPDYLSRHPLEAAIDVTGLSSKSKVGIVRLTGQESYYKRELVGIVEYLSASYDADGILLSGLSYRDEDYGAEALSDYINFMRAQGIEVRDWPRTSGGSIDAYDSRVGNWKSARMESLLSELQSIVHGNNKEFWVIVDVSWESPALLSSEYGLPLTMVEKHADRIILDCDFASHGVTSNFFVEIAKALPIARSERYTPLLYLSESPDDLKKSLTDITNLKYYSFGVVPYSSLTTPYKALCYTMGFRQEADFSPDIRQLWDNGFYDDIPRVYQQLLREDALRRDRERRKAKQDFVSAKTTYQEIEKSILEADRYGVATDSFKASFQELKGTLITSETRFVEENFSESSRISLATLSSSEALKQKIKNAIDEKLSERFSLSVALVLLFFIILVFSAQYLRRRR